MNLTDDQKREIKAQLETGLVLRQIDQGDGFEAAFPMCNLCGELIKDWSMANIEWFRREDYENHSGRGDFNGGPVFALHKQPCSAKLENAGFHTSWLPLNSIVSNDQRDLVTKMLEKRHGR